MNVVFAKKKLKTHTWTGSLCARFSLALSATSNVYSDAYIFSELFILAFCCLFKCTKCSHSRSMSIDVFSYSPFSVSSLIFLLFVCVWACVLNLAPFYVKYIEHSLDIILSIFSFIRSLPFSLSLSLPPLVFYCLSFSLFIEAFHSNVYLDRMMYACIDMYFMYTIQVYASSRANLHTKLILTHIHVN